jgi:hypothetical protein
MLTDRLLWKLTSKWSFGQYRQQQPVQLPLSRQFSDHVRRFLASELDFGVIGIASLGDTST